MRGRRDGLGEGGAGIWGYVGRRKGGWEERKGERKTERSTLIAAVTRL